jgi:hypothetical protein
MSGVEPVDPRVRLAISQWPDDPPRGAVTSFCSEHGISRKTFYVLLGRARAELLPESWTGKSVRTFGEQFYARQQFII